ncbi:hypothetical protein BDV25DRAFT_143848 [Aspergillus avenaceus]|uniref:Protein-tyrosine phosphatase-like protein n=1 Tax=Aspergillus avenaceus TaxID=36643 RepID=A0A5N6TJL2_ASPAV|nr:hypothetical protein BDV25DRAFT_143848 [Aspergillus avenaceus]
MFSYFLFFAIWLLQVQAISLDRRDGSSKPGFLTHSKEELDAEFKKLSKGERFKTNMGEYYNDEVYWDGHFGRRKDFEKEHPFDYSKDGVDDRDHEYSGGHPRFSASRLPGLADRDGEFSYIATHSPLYLGRSQKYLYWDLIYKHTKGSVVIVDLVNYGPDPLVQEDEGQEDLIPTKKTGSLSFSPPNKIEIQGEYPDQTVKDLGKPVPPYEGKYNLLYRSHEKMAYEDIEYTDLILNHESSVNPKERRNIGYFHLKNWKNRSVITADIMQALIEEVDKKAQDATILVNCMYGQGRTGTFIEAREIYNVTVKAKNTKWFFSSEDPIKDYTVKLRKTRSQMLDSPLQWEYMHNVWAARMWDRMSAGTKRPGDGTQSGPATKTSFSTKTTGSTTKPAPTTTKPAPTSEKTAA